MKQLATLICILPLILGCEKPDSGLTIPPPTNKEAATETGQNQDPNQDPGTGDGTGTTTPIAGNIIVGYATYWDKTMPDPTLLTHINYAFAHIKSDFESLDIKTESRLSKIAAA